MARWFAVSTQFLTDPKVERMIDRHGNDAVAVTLALFTQAMLQERGGVVERSYRTLAKEANVDRETAFAVVETAAEVDFLTLVEGDDYEFRVDFPAWSRHQAAYRKAKSRAEKKADNHAGLRVEVTDSHEQSRAVTKSHSQDRTGQDRRRQEKSTSAVPAADAPLSNLLADLIAENDPNHKRPNVTKRWADEEDRMLRIDGRKPHEAERLIRWTQANSFWRGNVLSMPRFREKYGQLYQAAVNEKQKREGNRPNGVSTAERFAQQARELEAQEAAA